MKEGEKKAVTIQTLVNITEIFEIYDSIQEAYDSLGRTAFCEEIHNCVKEIQESYLLSKISYMLDFSQEDDDWVIGITEPERLIEKAVKWNEQMVGALCRELNNFEAFKNRYGINSMAELFRKLEGGRTEAGFDYPLSLYRLRYCLCDLDDRFTYGCNNMVLELEEYGYGHSVKIPDTTLANIKEHPEEYAIIETYYK